MSDSEAPTLALAPRKRACLDETPSNTPDDCTQRVDYSDSEDEPAPPQQSQQQKPLFMHPFFEGTGLICLTESPVPPVAHRTPPPRPSSADQANMREEKPPLLPSPASCNFHEGPCHADPKRPAHVMHPSEIMIGMPFDWPNRAAQVLSADDQEKVRLWNAVVEIVRKHGLKHKLVGDSKTERLYTDACVKCIDDIRALM